MMTMPHFRQVAFATALLLHTFPARAGSKPPFWEDGNFTQYEPTSGTFTIFDTGERYQAWMIVGQNGNVAFTSGAYVHDGFHFVDSGKDKKGRHVNTKAAWMNLAGLSQTATGIMQHDVATTPGEQYQLTFYVGNIYDPGGPYGTTSTVAMYQNSTLVGTYTNAGGQGSNEENWKLFTVTFTATAPYTSIAFINMDPPGDMNCGLDDVTFKEVTAGPKPVTPGATP